MSILLGMLGYDVREARTGHDALELVATFGPHVVLLDLNLGRGGMSGFDVARALRATCGDQPYLVAVTGYSDDILPLARDAGFDRLVCKPLSTRELNELLAAVEHALA